jgi:N-acetylglucosaminyldiphosphoundecaprenol N-acetyl-beta-D-mannosaminyltransferase
MLQQQESDRALTAPPSGETRRIGMRGVRGSSTWPSIFSRSIEDARTALIECLIGSSGRCTTVAFLNMPNFVTACRQGTAELLFHDFDFVFGDGVGLQIVKRLARLPRSSRVSGTDLVPALLSDTRCRGLRVFLLGGPPQLIAQTAERFSTMFPAHRLVGSHHGYLSAEETLRVIELIEVSRPDLLLIGMGTPIQELWLREHRDRLRVGMTICVGGLFHYWHGSLRRAPRALQRVGLEWTWILAQQPAKWRRYLFGAWHLLRAVPALRREQRRWT